MADTRDERLNDERLMDDLRQHDRRIYEQGVRDAQTGHAVRYVDDIPEDEVRNVRERPVQVVTARRGHGGLIAFFLILIVALAVAAAYVMMPTSTTTSTATKTVAQSTLTPPPSGTPATGPAVTPPDTSQAISVTPDTATGTTSAQAPTSQTVE